MKWNDTIKRALRRTVSLALALELFCAPVAMAQAERALYDETPETPVEDVSPAQPGDETPESGDGGDSQSPAQPMWNYSGYFTYAQFSYGLPRYARGGLAAFDGYLNPEDGWDGDIQWRQTGTPDYVTAYVTLPETGRVPDREFAGYYVYDKEGMIPSNEDIANDMTGSYELDWYSESNTENQTKIKNWSYEDLTSPIALDDVVTDLDPDDMYLDEGTLVRLQQTYGELTAECDYTSPEGIPEGREYLPVVGRWVKSSRAEITRMSMRTGEDTIETVYTADITGKHLDDVTANALTLADYAGSAENGEVWLRVPHDQATLTLEFDTYEPYYDYLKQFIGTPVGDPLTSDAACPVTVTATYGAAETAVPAGTLSGEISPKATVDQYGYWTPQNSAADPARGSWTVADIPLTAADGDAEPYTTLTVTITAPDGTTSREYVIHVQRLAATTSTLGWGNTPWGMIERDESAVWDEKKTYTDDEGVTRYYAQSYYDEVGGTLTTVQVRRANKDYAKARFAGTRSFQGMAYVPQDAAHNQSGNIFKGLYTNCWPEGKDYDLNDVAIVAYQDSAFQDPGVSFTDSEGNRVAFGAGAETAPYDYETCVTRTIALRTGDSLTVDLYGAGRGTQCWYDGAGGLADTETAVPLTDPDGHDQVNLRGLRVLPGMYTIVYTFTDPVTKAQTVARRPLVILPIPGDVDMDGATTAADAVALEQNMDTWNGSSDTVVTLARHRVFDRNHNGQLEGADILAAFQGFQPALTTGSGSDYLYLPLPEGTGSAVGYSRKTWDQVPTAVGDGTLTLEYLGVETGTGVTEEFATAANPAGVTTDPSGPWAADAARRVTLHVDGTNPDGTPLAQNDVFWMGVKLAPGALSGEQVEAFTITLVYDSRYVSPALVYTAEQLREMNNALGTPTDADKWEYMLRYYNLGEGGFDSLNARQSIWANAGVTYDFTAATDRQKGYATHYSKVISDLESRYIEHGKLNTDYIREMVFSIEVKTDATGTVLENEGGYVLAVPFRLVTHPAGLEEQQDGGNVARLVELGAGMRDFNMVTRPKPRNVFSSLINDIVRLFTGVASTTTAYSAQEEIYGGATRNIREEVEYDDASGMVPMGADMTTRKVLKNQLVPTSQTPDERDGRYADAFQFTGLKVGGTLRGELPPGLTFDEGLGRIDGTPTQVGEYNFQIDNSYYQIIVRPRTIRYYAENQTSYYGEDELRGDAIPKGENPLSGKAYRTFTYRYYTEDVADRDRNDPMGENSPTSADGEDLAGILGHFTAPVFVAQTTTEDGETVTVERDSHVGTYDIRAVTAPSADNYVFEQVDADPDSREAGKLRIMQRPVYVDYLAVTADNTGATVYHDEGTSIETGLTASTDRGDTVALTLGGFAGLPDRPITGDAALAGDVISITFTGRFQQLDSDKVGGNTGFIMTKDKEPRPMSVSDIVLTGECAENYVLQHTSQADGVPLRPEQCDVQGYVLRRGVEEIVLMNLPLMMTGAQPIYHGNAIASPTDLRLRIVKGTGSGSSEEGTFQYNAQDALVLGLHYNWVTEEEYLAGKDSATLEGSGRYTENVLAEDGVTILHHVGDDIRPYGLVENGVFHQTGMTARTFTPADTGMRLCISVGKYTTGVEGEYIKIYTDPITVLPNPIVLTPKSAERYYGDENPQFIYTYDPQALSSHDREMMEDHFGVSRLKGSMEELEWLLGEEQAYYDEHDPEGHHQIVPPSFHVQVSETDATPVTAGTDYSATPYKAILSGGQSVNYAFSYRSADPGVQARSDYGWANLTVNPRPIVVDTVARDNFGTIYADTTKLTVDWQTLAGQPVSLAADETRLQTPLTLANNEVTFTLPDMREGTGNIPVYYRANRENNTGVLMDKLTVAFSDASVENNVAVLEKDKAGLEVRYDVTFIPDRGFRNDFTESYYNIDYFDEEKNQGLDVGYQSDNGSRVLPVQVDHLTLAGPAAKNYVLVFKTDYNAQWQVPAVTEPVMGYNPNVRPAVTSTPSYAYQSAGTGTVLLRPIEEMTLTKLGLMDYTYGEEFAPNLPPLDAPNTDPGLTLTVTYATVFDNDVDHNTHQEEVVFQAVRESTTFADRGFTLGYTHETTEGAAQRALAEGKTLEYLEFLTPGKHDGAHLWVMGKRNPKDPMVFSQVTNGTLRVDRRALTLTAKDVHRFYGEPNETDAAPFTFTARAGDLARPDVETLVAAGVLPANYKASTPVPEEALATLAGYQAPIFDDSAATPASPVGEGDWGRYPLEMTVSETDGNDRWDNYQIQAQGANIYVYKRPIQELGITSTTDRPVYTIYSSVSTTTFTTQLGTQQVDPSDAVVVVKKSANQSVKLSTGAYAELPLTGDALFGADQLVFTVSVNYYKGTTLPENSTNSAIETRTVVEGMDPSDTARNYSFTRAGSADGWETYGAIKIRSIREVHILELPKLEYIYGETLDLSGLKVQVIYDIQDGSSEDEEREIVTYRGREQFESHGLYINYWTPGRAIPTDNDARKSLVDTDIAQTGDHVTIAPTHETQGTAQEFRTNGKQLILSAFQPGDEQRAIDPILLGEEELEYFEGDPVHITVYPRRLTYQLSAQDKTYDGTTRAAGTLTLTNVFQDGDLTDVVYVPLGASYERPGSVNYRDFLRDFIPLVGPGGVVSFTTGTYSPNGEAPLEPSGAINWSANNTQGEYSHGTGLTFNFANPNVHYVDDTFQNGRVPGLGAAMADYWAASQAKNTVTTRWDRYNAVSQLPVEVTNMVLAGPDAENYTWGEPKETRVSETNVSVATRANADREQAAAPYATIHKANRSTIQTLAGSGFTYPTLAVDNHTNVVRLTYGQDIGVLGDNNNLLDSLDEFRDELHFEYALYYRDADGLYRQWAGRLGTAPYQDTMFFGGEAVPVRVPAGYLPDLEKLIKQEDADENTIYKGQRYRWDGLDTGVSAAGSSKGWREDGGFVLNLPAYPGYTGLSEQVDLREAYWFYDLYTTDRAPLPRDTVVYPLVRLSETHNYNASGSLSGDAAVTAELLDAAQKSAAAARADESLMDEARTASDALFAACGEMETQARENAQAIQDYVAQLAESGRWPEPEDAPSYDNEGAAVKTYAQRVDIVSSETTRSDPDVRDDTEYLVETLEAVWFTDTLVYREEKLWNAMVYNHPTRYYGYYYDIDLSAPVRFTTDEYLDLQDLIRDIKIRRRREDGTTVEELITVNQDHTIRVYAQVVADDARKVRRIDIVPGELTVTLGAEPYQLELFTIPEKPSNRRYRWESSDVSVVTVDENGLLTFRGAGTAVVTVYTNNNRKGECVVTVVLPEPPERLPLFNENFSGSFMELYEDGNFYPKRTMTRGELVILVDLLCRPNELWLEDVELGYVDMDRQERYAEAVRRMTVAGVVRGVPGNAFEGDREATRAEFATMIARVLELPVPDTRGRVHAFSDTGEDQTWAYAYIDALAKASGVQGNGEGRFEPSRLITREEVAAIVARLLCTELSEGQQVRVPADVSPENWSYQAILRAVNAVEFPMPEDVPEAPAE